MREDLSEVFKRISNKAHELANYICERAKPVFSDLDYNMMLTGEIQDTITWHFGKKDEVCMNSSILIHMLKEIVKLKDICLESQIDYCLFIEDMLEYGRLSTDRYRIRYDDFEPVRNNDYEKITTDMNELFKLGLNASERNRKQFNALFTNLRYLYYKNNNDLLKAYTDCVGWHLTRFEDNETIEKIIKSNYILYSVWLKDYQGDKQLYNAFGCKPFSY
jgi:hypothetical protein